MTSNFAECRCYRTFNISLLLEAKVMVGYAGTPICIVNVDMTLTDPRSRSRGNDRHPPLGLYLCRVFIHLIVLPDLMNVVTSVV